MKWHLDTSCYSWRESYSKPIKSFALKLSFCLYLKDFSSLQYLSVRKQEFGIFGHETTDCVAFYRYR